MIRCQVFLILAALAHSTAIAYEQSTHALITQQAYLRSSLASTGSAISGLDSLGLNTLWPLGRDLRYFELGVDAIDGAAIRYAQEYEVSRVKAFTVSLDNSPTTWLMFGAIREDDNPKEDPPTPQDVEPNIKRPMHHFYDPYFDRPLVPFVSMKNPDWAIGSSDSFVDPNLPDSARINRFTIIDAREAMFRALTLKGMSEDHTYIDLSAGVDESMQERSRQAYWATAFRALGDVLHLNQDMAQPQHSRNEMHSGIYCLNSLCPAGHTSVYEKYIDARARKRDTFAAGKDLKRVAVRDLTFGSYAIPAFSKYTDYWSTSRGSGKPQGKGLADYSNRGFFTVGKNFDSKEFQYPSRSITDYLVALQVPTQWDGTDLNDATPVKVYYGRVTDVQEGSVRTTVPLTTLSVWDQFFQEKSKEPRYSLNRLNYDAMADLLLPRAVAYSAGLINFFFRGRLLISLPKEGVYAISDHGSPEGFKTLRVAVKNATGAFVDPQGEDQPQHMRGGTFFAVIRYHTDKKYVDSLDTIVGIDPCDDYFEVVNPAKFEESTGCRDGVEQIAVSEPLIGESLDVNAEKTLKFAFAKSPIPFAMTDVMLQIVYRGPLGSETDAVAVGSLDISEPTYFTYQNDTDYIHLGSHVYTRAQVNADPSLLALVQPQYCVDYRLSPPRLLDSCLTTFDIDIDLSFESVSTPIAHASTLPARRFLRLVYLTDVNESFNPPLKTVARRITTQLRDSDAEEKAYLYHQSICLPLDPFFIRARESQMKIVAPGQAEYVTSSFSPLRAVNGWRNEGCVVNGDESPPGTTDDRVVVMSGLTPDSDEVRPYRITIAQEYQPIPEP